MNIRKFGFLSAPLLAMVLMMGAFVPGAAADRSRDASPCDVQVAACGKCGDGYCARQCGETAQSCPKDCGVERAIQLACGKCGDGYCAKQCGETAKSCPKDCGVESERVMALAD